MYVVKSEGMFLNRYNKDEDTTLFTIHLVIMVIGIMTNLFPVVMVATSHKLRSVQGICYILNLSCANLVFFIFLGLNNGFSVNFKGLPDSYCSVISAGTTFSCTAASLFRAIIALDRYVYISDPLHYYIRSSDSLIVLRTVILLAVAGLLTLTSYITAVFFNGGLEEYCYPIPGRVYSSCIVLVGVILPMFYEVFVYTRIFFWASRHIHIMRREARYTRELRQRNVKYDYNVDIRQLELFTRASFLMASAVFAMKSPGGEETGQKVEANEVEMQTTSWTFPLRRFTASSIVTTYLGSLLKFSNTTKSTMALDQIDEAQDGAVIPKLSFYNTRRSCGSGTALDFKQACLDAKRQSTFPDSDQEEKRPEDVWLEEQLQRLSRKIDSRKGSDCGSLTLYKDINKLLTFTKLKAGLILLLILGTAVGFWLPFIIITLLQFTVDYESLAFYRKVANLFVYALSSMDPLVYDLLHPPIRTALKDKVKVLFKIS